MKEAPGPERAEMSSECGAAPRRTPGLIAVLREALYSPGMVDHDAAILRDAAERLSVLVGAACPVVSIDELSRLPGTPDLILSMAEGDDALALLERLEARGAIVVNAPSAVRATRRAALLELSRPKGPLVEGTLVATDDGRDVPGRLLATGSAWVKRADYHALGTGDVVKAEARDLEATLRSMHARGITHAVVQPHVPGEVVKFYAVSSGAGPDAGGRGAGGRDFFCWFATSPGGKGPTPEAAERLRGDAFAAARAAGILVFGGDAVLPASGDSTPVVIDLNAWPSFWRCRAEAARAIADMACARLGAACKSRSARREPEKTR